MPQDKRRNARINIEDIKKGIAQHEEKASNSPTLFQKKQSPPRHSMPTDNIKFNPVTCFQ